MVTRDAAPAALPPTTGRPATAQAATGQAATGIPGTVRPATGLPVTVPPPRAPEPVEVLLIEDDDGDALLVEELLAEAAVPVTAHRARSLSEAMPLPDGVNCVLL